MNKNSLGNTKMNYKFLLSAGFLGVLLLSGCASNNDYEYNYSEAPAADDGLIS